MSGKQIKIVLIATGVAAAIAVGCWVRNHSQRQAVRKTASPVTMYSKPTCPYCIRALQFFKGRGITVQVFDITEHPEIHREMIERSSRNTQCLRYLSAKGT